MRSFSWEIFVGAILLFFVALLVSNENYQQERRDREDTSPSRALERSIAITIEKSIQAANDAVEVANQAVEAKTQTSDNDNKQNKNESLSSKAQNLEFQIEQKAQELKQKINENTTGRLAPSQAVQAITDPSQQDRTRSLTSSEVRMNEWTVPSPGIYSYSLKLQLNTQESLSIDIPFGSIEFIGESTSEPLLILKASGKNTDTIWLQNQLRIIDSNTDNGVNIFISRSDEESATFQLQATLIVPEESNVDAKTNSGHIELANIAGTHSLKTNGGHIEVMDVTGSLAVESGGGHIDIIDMRGDLELFTEGGHISIDNVSGTVKATTNGGQVNVKRLEGNIWALTKGGNITASIEEADEQITLITEAGNIRLLSSESKPYFCTMNANAGIDFGNSGIVGNLFGVFTGFLFPQDKLNVYASDLQEIFNSMDLEAPGRPSFGSFGPLPVVSLSAELGSITAEFE